MKGKFCLISVIKVILLVIDSYIYTHIRHLCIIMKVCFIIFSLIRQLFL